MGNAATSSFAALRRTQRMPTSTSRQHAAENEEYTVAKGSDPKRPGAQASSGTRPPRPSNNGPKVPNRSGAGRQSVAAARRSSAGSNRTQLIIGGVAIVVIAAIVVVGLVLNKKNTAVQGDPNYVATKATATVQDGAILLKAGNPAKTIDLYEDAMCPICGQFEEQYGKQLAQQVDDGNIAVRLQMLHFLNRASSSGDYSQRAAGALLAVATEAGDQPGLVLKYHSAIFSPDFQPQEGSGNKTNQELADLAQQTGVPAATVKSIADGKYVQQAADSAKKAEDDLSAKFGQNWGTPMVLDGGAPVNTQQTDWLTKLIG
ncbi:thioredoxin domain-containing protein [Nakamurella aerolata]|uniref:Thioredoxin domain-containing protein n=1 Tax=Nakamurella aerolata TaxID=1656892 RepID=A0A849ADK4_9ACTN|nr:thioredoxin domain-containing protein [Nakamurella aerolata]